MANPQKQFNQALQLHQGGQVGEAIALYQAALPRMEQNPQLLFLLGTAYLQVGNHDDCVDMMQRALRLESQNVFAHINLGNGLLALQRYGEAVAAFDRALALKPGLPEVHNSRGAALLGLGRMEEALAAFDRALALNPDDAEAHNNRGVVLVDQGRAEEALLAYDRALALHADYAEAYFNRGNALKQLNRLEAAVAAYDQALALAPDAETHLNRGNALHVLSRLDEALLAFDRALMLRPDYAAALSNRGLTYQGLMRLDEASASYAKAIDLDAGSVDAHWNQSLLLILTGQYLEGWELYEWRLRKEDMQDQHYTFPQPVWRGRESIEGQRIFVYAEQGFGDAIQFCRYLPQLSALGAEVVFEVQKALLPLVSTLDGPVNLVAKGERLPGFDVYCPVMSLPYAFATTVETIPAEIPYLYADKAKVARWRQRLGDTDRIRVGLVWSGSSGHKNDAQRSIRFETLLPLTGLAVEFHALHKEYRDHDLESLAKHPEIHQHQQELLDFADTAALIECMDLVISVDTSVAHLAGAMGKPVWVLLPFAPDYRWMLNREDSPWYPTARLFRQPAIGDWSSVIAEVTSALQGYDV